MKTRIKYKKKGNILLSEWFLAGSMPMQVSINKLTRTYYIKDPKDIIYSQGTSDNIVDLKKRVKDTLISMRVRFDNEIRRRG